jgi:hypothetical protein
MTRYALAALLVAAPAAAAFAQAQGLTLEQVERKYPRMSYVHINKCDYDGNGIFTRTEMLCVSGIYQQMYLDRD